ncbi:MAG: hypothetical protein HY858_09865 [Candidatus Solibacter usitatus]|nr:hypothetical protein [Candidatus Solibacter usitatus]
MKGRQWLILAAVLAMVIGVRYAEPIQDSDAFWQMAYAKQMIERGTLRLDHTVFSWMPASNAMIYCAWIGELILYGVWRLAGLAGLFALRYGLVLAVVAGMALFARRRGLLHWPVTWLVLLVVTLAGSAGTLIKPEIFSLMLWNAMLWVYFRARYEDSRWYYVMPAILLVWVNTHGAFIVAAPFLAVVLLSQRAFKAAALCVVATLVNPYAWRYPYQLLRDYALRGTPRPDEAWNSAHQSITSPLAADLHFTWYLGIMAALLATIFALHAWRKPPGERVELALLAANLVYIPLFAVYLRTTYFWPALFGYTFLHLASTAPAAPILTVTHPWLRDSRKLRKRLWHWRAATVSTSVDFGARAARQSLTAAALAAFLFLAGRAGWDAWRHPSAGSWLGFGVNYSNPVEEAEFLASRGLGGRIYNLFNSGGYLLWRLYPQNKVMVDARSFPYLQWFDQQSSFAKGDEFAEFIKRHPADVAVIELSNVNVWRHFLRQQDWRLVFYGPSAAVFAKVQQASGIDGRADPERFTRLRNGQTAMWVFQFACFVADYPAAWAVLDHVENQLKHEVPDSEMQRAVEYRQAHEALQEHKWENARVLFRRVLAQGHVSDRDRLILTLLESRDQSTGGAKADAAVFEAALRRLASGYRPR